MLDRNEKTEQYTYINRNLSLALLKMLTKLNRIELLEKTHKIYYNIFYFMTNFRILLFQLSSSSSDS